MFKIFSFLLISLGILCSCSQSTNEKSTGSHSLKFIDKIVIENSNRVDSTIVGGLSSIDYRNGNSYVVISDDRSEYSPARIYDLQLDFDTSGFGDYSFVKTTFLKDRNGTYFDLNELDPESVRYRASTDTYFYTSEGGRTEELLNPFIWEIDREGFFVSEVEVSEIFGFYGEKGIRENGGFESLSFENDTIIWYANELPLKEDGDVPGVETGSYPLRLSRHDIKNDTVIGQYVYNLSTLKKHPNPIDGFYINSVPEILYIKENILWVLERSYVQGIGNFAELFEIEIDHATDIKDMQALYGNDYEAVKKKLILDFSNFNQKIDNIEGMTFGPDFSDGSKSLIFISDDNFNEEQETQLWLFSVVVEK